MFYSCEKSITIKNSVISIIKKFPSLVLPKNTIIPQQLIIQYPLHYLPRGRVQEVKNKKNVNLSAIKVVPATYKRRSLQKFHIIIVIWLWCFEKLVTEEKCLLTSFEWCQNFDFWACQSKNVIKHDTSGKNTWCFVAKAIWSTLELIWPTQDMGKKLW